MLDSHKRLCKTFYTKYLVLPHKWFLRQFQFTLTSNLNRAVTEINSSTSIEYMLALYETDNIICLYVAMPFNITACKLIHAYPPLSLTAITFSNNGDQ